MEKKKLWKFRYQSLAFKVLIQVGIIAVILFSTNLLIYWQVNRTMQKLDNVYMSNVSLTELADSLKSVQMDMYSYLTVKSSDSLESYYRSEQNYNRLLEKLNEQVMENPTKHLEKNIRKTSETYLEQTAETVLAKRGRNVEKYKNSYAQTEKLYDLDCSFYTGDYAGKYMLERFIRKKSES